MLELQNLFILQNKSTKYFCSKWHFYTTCEDIKWSPVFPPTSI